MPTLVCTRLDGDELSALLEALRRLHESGQALAVWAPRLGRDAVAEIAMARDAAGLALAWEEQRLALIGGGDGSVRPPEWIPWDECDRILVVGAAAPRECGNVFWKQWRDSPAASDAAAASDRELLEALFAGGCETVEWLAPADIVELHQSWTSGRRTGLRLLR